MSGISWIHERNFRDERGLLFALDSHYARQVIRLCLLTFLKPKTTTSLLMSRNNSMVYSSALYGQLTPFPVFAVVRGWGSGCCRSCSRLLGTMRWNCFRTVAPTDYSSHLGWSEFVKVEPDGRKKGAGKLQDGYLKFIRNGHMTYHSEADSNDHGRYLRGWFQLFQHQSHNCFLPLPEHSVNKQRTHCFSRRWFGNSVRNFFASFFGLLSLYIHRFWVVLFTKSKTVFSSAKKARCGYISYAQCRNWFFLVENRYT